TKQKSPLVNAEKRFIFQNAGRYLFGALCVGHEINGVMLIRDKTDYTWFNLYQPGFREYCTIPLDFDELNLFLKRIGIIN
ncbi:MAG TPA: hypothetical protein VHO69_00125, partial [Phototrophicaceae bacterium]|nr:hypothetical protein [Phototrophicaceae bacterium]